MSKEHSTDLPKCCDEMKNQKETSYPPEDGVFWSEDGKTLIMAADGVWAATDVKFCPWCGKAVGA